MRYLVDIDWLIDVLSGIDTASRTPEQLASDGVSVSIITVGELYQGAVLGPHSEATLERYREFLAAFAVLGLSEPVMERFARERAQLRRAGTLRPDFDLVIAARALGHDLVLLTRSRKHFERVSNLKIY